MSKSFNQELTMNNATDPSEDAEISQPRRKPSKGIYMLPNMITLAALFAGFYAVVMAMNGRLIWRLWGFFVPWCWTVWMAVWPG